MISHLKNNHNFDCSFDIPKVTIVKNSTHLNLLLLILSKTNIFDIEKLTIKKV